MATLREHMEENEDLVLLFVRKKGDQNGDHQRVEGDQNGDHQRQNGDQQKENGDQRENNNRREEIPNFGFVPSLPEGISLRGRSSDRSSIGTSCYGECRDSTGEEEAFTDPDTSVEEGSDDSYFFDEEDSYGEEQLSSSEDGEDDEEEEPEEDLGAARVDNQVSGTRFGGITVRQPASTSLDSSDDSFFVVQHNVLILREDDADESASDMSESVSGDPDSDRLDDTTATDGEFELGEIDVLVHTPETFPSESTEAEEENSSSNNTTEEFLVTRIQGITVTRRQGQDGNSEERHDIQPALALQSPSEHGEGAEGVALVPLDRDQERPAALDRQAVNNPTPSNHRVIERLARMGITVTRRPLSHHHHRHQRIRIQDHQDTDQSGSDSDVDSDDDDMPVLIRDLDLMEREE